MDETRRRPWLEALKQTENPAILTQSPQSVSVKSVTSPLDDAETALGDPEVTWRIAAMRPQIPARGPIPFLVARPGILRADAPGRCESCGEPREEGQRYICRACQRAKWQVLNEVREDVPAAPQREGQEAA